MWNRSFGRPRNDVVLPAGWRVTTPSSIPATVSLTDDGRVRLAFVNPRPDSIDVFVKARRSCARRCVSVVTSAGGTRFHAVPVGRGRPTDARKNSSSVGCLRRCCRAAAAESMTSSGSAAGSGVGRRCRPGSSPPGPRPMVIPVFRVVIVETLRSGCCLHREASIPNWARREVAGEIRGSNGADWFRRPKFHGLTERARPRTNRGECGSAHPESRSGQRRRLPVLVWKPNAMWSPEMARHCLLPWLRFQSESYPGCGAA